jgi:hypothetical protein
MAFYCAGGEIVPEDAGMEPQTMAAHFCWRESTPASMPLQKGKAMPLYFQTNGEKSKEDQLITHAPAGMPLDPAVPELTGKIPSR